MGEEERRDGGRSAERRRRSTERPGDREGCAHSQASFDGKPEPSTEQSWSLAPKLQFEVFTLKRAPLPDWARGEASWAQHLGVLQLPLESPEAR